MPSLNNNVSTNDSIDSYVHSAFSAATTLGALLMAAVERARGKATAGHSIRQKPASTIESSMSRVPLTDVRSIFSANKAERSLKKSSKKLSSENNIDIYPANTDDIPQRLVADSLPKVHDRLPDPTLWTKIEDELIKQEQTFSSSSRITSKASNNNKKHNDKLSSLREASKQPKTSTTAKSPSRSRRSLSGIPQLEGVLRRRQLYCRTGYHIQILPNGRVTGTDKDHDRYAILEVASVDVGIITMRGVDSGRYLSMDSKGRLYGSASVTQESYFEETLQENWYNTYSSTRYRNNRRSCYLALGRNGRSRHGCRSNANQRFTHFLPRPVDPAKVPNLYKGILY